MATKSQHLNEQDGALSSMNAAIDALNLAGEATSVKPAKVVFSSASVLLTGIRGSMIDRMDCVKLGLACADACKALDQGMKGRRWDQFSQSVLEAIEQLTAAVVGIQKNVIKLAKRNAICRLFHAKNDKRRIAAWKLELDRIGHIFNTELAINTLAVVSDIRHEGVNTHAIISDIRQCVANTHAIVSELQHNVRDTQIIVSDAKRTVLKSHIVTQTQASIHGESPPPPPRVCFGRDELIEKAIGFAENLTPIALIGVGGIGKTSIALTVLHSGHIKQRFGENRRFIRCDQFPAALAHFLRRLSEVIGAGIKNPESLTPLIPFLSSEEMLIVLDNAESILDPRGANAHEIYDAVEELSHFSNICLCITSRISTIPPDCRTLEIPTLSMEPARDAFYRIYQQGEQSELVDDILERLDFHPLSITLLATVAHHNKWGTDRLSKEWEKRRTGVLETEHNKSLAATVELSLASPMFQGLGPDAQGLLGVVAFFPQGVDENNIDWLFPTTSDGAAVFDKFCVLSLTYRNNGFITMLAPLRDYLSPKNPTSSPLLCTTKERYFTRMSVDLDNPNVPGFNDARWITSEDVNVEHLLDGFTSFDANSENVWKACADFMRHIFWHKKRLIVLRPKIEGLPDDHPSKPECLFELSQLFRALGNHTENKQLLIHTLRLYRKREDGYRIAQMLMFLAYVNQSLSLFKEGISQAKEASEICERFNIASLRGHSLRCLAWLLRDDNQLDAAEAAAFRAIDAFTDRGDKYGICRSYNILGAISHRKGRIEEALSRFEAALGMASAHNWHRELFVNHFSLAELFFDEERFDDAHAHVERAKSHAADDPFQFGCGMQLQARFLHKQQRHEEAMAEVLKAIEVFEKIGTTVDLEKCRDLLQDIRKELN